MCSLLEAFSATWLHLFPSTMPTLTSFLPAFRAAFAPGSILLNPTAPPTARQTNLLAQLHLAPGTAAPTAVLYDAARQRVFLLEAAAAGGPITEARRQALAAWAAACPGELVYVSAFATRKDFALVADQIAWRTEVWLADAPQHLIHFNGDRFVGPR